MSEGGNHNGNEKIYYNNLVKLVNAAKVSTTRKYMALGTMRKKTEIEELSVPCNKLEKDHQHKPKENWRKRMIKKTIKIN